MLELKNIDKIYKTKSGDTHALKNVSLSFQETGMVFINGKSGSGKTTLLNIIGGLDGIDGGEVIIDGKNFDAFTDAEYDAYRNTYVGFIFQEYNLLGDFSVAKNIEIATELQGKQADEQEIARLLDDFDIKEYLHRDPSELSGGQKQRVAIARALIKRPKIIIADEPTGALDSQTGTQVIELLKKLSDKTLVIVVSHDRELAKNYADRIISLKDGQIESDVMIREIEPQSSVYQTEKGIIVRSGSNLSGQETQRLVQAIAQRENVEFTDKIFVREEYKTDQSAFKKQAKPAAFVNSKMKLKSAATLGFKFLKVKPLRLIITILLSVVAFSVFGLFDTVASYSKAKVMAHTLQTAGLSGVALSGKYAVDKGNYEVRVSQSEIDAINKKTGFNFRGVYDINDHTFGYNKEKTIYELISNSILTGKYYYYKSINGFVEFKNSEIKGDVVDQNGFNCKVICGRYPSSFDQVGISKYTAESIMKFIESDGGAFGAATVNEMSDLIGKNISFYSPDISFKISAIIDCGKLPAKYDRVKTLIYSNDDSALINDLYTYLNNGLFMNLFVSEGFVENYRAANGRQTSYYGPTATYGIKYQSNQSGNYVGNTRFYLADQIDKENLLLIDGASKDDFALADGQVIIAAQNLRYVYSEERLNASGSQQELLYEYLSTITDAQTTIEQKQQALDQYIALNSSIANGDSKRTAIKNIQVTQTRSADGEKTKLNLDVVGIYFGLDTDLTSSSSWLPLAITDSDMESFNIYAGQGDYSRIISPANTSRRACKTLAKMATASSGLTFEIFENSIYQILEQGEKIIKQAANLFLYVSIVMAAFSVLMLFNYISTSIATKRQSIGILKGLGASKRDIFRTFMIESLILSLIVGVLSIGVAYAGCYLVNYYVKEIMNITLDIAIFEFKQVAVILGASVLTGIISSIIPIIKITKEKPVNLIRKN